MFKLFARFRLIDWLLFAAICGLVVGQVYFDVTMPDYTQEMYGKMFMKAATNSILKTGGMMLLYATGSMGCSIIITFIATYLAAKFSQRLRRGVFSKVQSFSFEETNKFSTASLITRSTNDIQQVQMVLMMILRMAITAPVTAIWAIIKINSGAGSGAGNGTLTLASAAWIVLLVVFLMTIFMIVIPRFRLIQKLTDKLNGVTRENLTGLRVVKAYNADGFQEEKFEKVNDRVTRNNLYVYRLMGLMMPVMLVVMNGLSLTVYWLGASLINKGMLDYGMMMKFFQLVMQVVMAFMMLTMLFIMVPRAQISAKRINEVLDTRPSINDPPEGALAEFTAPGEVEFKNVSFRYPGAEGYVLKNISFKVNKGETAAIIGGTGSGKSTLINLVPRFYDASEGEVLVDGANVKNVKQESLRGRIGYVTQKGVLFSGAVAENIAYGRESVIDEKITEAAKVAMAHDFVSEMEGGYGADIAQGGKNVSGGQRQRLSIARAVAIDPEIYIFDDSFSALDYKTDKTVRENLKKHTKDATSLIVAQRIGTIMDADKIIVLDKGETVGIGTHKELLKKCAVYREIALSQLTEAELGL